MAGFEIILLMSAIVVLGFIVRGMTGFGGTLIITPLALLFLDVKLAIPVILVISFLGNLYLVYHVRKDINKKIFLTFLIPSIVGIAIGTYLLKVLDSRLITILLAIFILIFSIKLFFSEKAKAIKRKIDRIKGNIAGFIAGSIDGFIGMGGPPIVMYFDYLGLKKHVFRATMVMIFIVFNISRLVTYTYSGLMSLEIIKTGIYLMPAMVIGTLIGMKMHFRLNEILFRKIVAVILLLIGVALLIDI